MAVPLTSSHQVQSGAILDAAAGGTITANNSVANTLANLKALSIRNAVMLREDFVAGKLGTNGAIGELGWSFNGTGSLGATAGPVGSMQGIAQLATGAANNQYVNLHLWDHSLAANTKPLFLAGNAWTGLFNILQSADSNTAKQVTIRVGFSQEASNLTPTDGFYFEYVATTVVASYASVTAKASAYTKTTGLLTGDAGQYTLEIRNDGSNNITFYINGTLAATHTANIATAALMPFFQIVTTESVGKYLLCDAFELLLAVSR